MTAATSFSFDPYSSSLSRRLAAMAQGVHRIDATLLFADVSGYTRLTERLAALGREGAERLTSVVNSCFTALIDEVFREDGEVVRFGGDALFIAFTGDGSLVRARRAARAMQRVIATLPAIAVPGGRVKLRQSMGLATGELSACVWTSSDGRWTEVLPFGTTVTATLAAESAAQAGEIREAPAVDTRRSTSSTPAPVDAAHLVPPTLARALAENADAEHRVVALSFVKVGGIDHVDDDELSNGMAALLHEVDTLQRDEGLTLLGTDVSDDGLKFIIGAGAPFASQDDAERLLVGARRIAGLRTPFHLHVGAHVGAVFCGDVGHPRRRTYTVMGDAVNLTARLMAAAHDGSLLASAALLDRVPHRFAFTWREPFRVKGKRAPVSAAIVGSPLTGVTAGGGAAWVGRVDERRRLAAAIDAGEPFVRVTGPAGSGSSRLVARVLDDLRRPAVWATARVGASGTSLEWVHDVLGNGHMPDDAAAAARRILHHLAGRVLVVDGADHLDPASKEVVARVVVEGALQGGTVIVTARTTDALEAPIDLGVVDIAVTPLDDASIRAIAIAASEHPLTEATIDAIVARAGGNPRFASWLAKTPEGSSEMHDTLPESMESAVMALFDRMPASVRSAVRAAAVVGELSDTDALVSVHGGDTRILTALRAAAPLVVERGDALAFADEGVRATVHAATPVATRRSLHRVAAHALVTRAAAPADATIARIADHYWHADSPAEALEWQRRAGDIAHSRGASLIACRHYQRALRMSARISDHRATLDLASRAADCADRAGLADVAIDVLRAAEPLAETPRARADLMRRRAVQYDWLGRTAQALRVLTMAAKQVRNDPTGADVAVEIDIERATVLLYSGRDAEAGRIADECIERARDCGNAVLLARALLVAMTRESTAGSHRATELGNEALMALDGHPDAAALRGSLLINLGVAADNRGDALEALEHYTAAQSAYESVGNLRHRCTAMSNRAGVLLELGHVDEARGLADDALREAAALGLPHEHAYAQGVLGRVRCWQGEVDEGLAQLERSRATLEADGDTETALFRACWHAEVLVAAGRHAEAAAAIDEWLPRVAPDSMLAHSAMRVLSLAGASTDDVRRLRQTLPAARGIEALFCHQALQRLTDLDPTEEAELLDLERRFGLTARLNAAPSPRHRRSSHP